MKEKNQNEEKRIKFQKKKAWKGVPVLPIWVWLVLLVVVVGIYIFLSVRY